ncbi:OmpA family protein [Hymenobacter sp. H14-R3]|uniref:OmpA family protein n=1 Tax=Hymenobacter sp. H14-R3 TaxID=3046308 RepID=UPI0024BB2F2F|nr:OmpA family protein [Hymenobacter sp. H14-R3]MDJ0364354.1 OmpA family protein [Hymenobacter sp. H14-R3]
MNLNSALFFMPALAAGLLVASAAHGQSVLWGSKIEEVSSQKAKLKEPYAPDKALGEPNAQPLGQLSNEAWSPGKDGSNEFIEVRFIKSILAQQVTVIENFNPGAITKIELIDIKGERHQVYSNPNPGPIPDPYRTLQVKFKPEKYRTVGVRVTLNAAKVDGVNQLDAIGVANVDVQIVKQDFKNPTSTGVETVQMDSTLKNLGPNINSRYVDTHPVISPDGRTMFFARQFHPGNRGGGRDPQDIWYSKLTSGKNQTWSLAKNLGTPPNGPEDPNGLASVSANGQVALLTGIYVDGFMEPKGFSTSRHSPGGWSVPLKVQIDNFINKDPEHVDGYLATSGKALLMAVERPEGQGGQDIFVSFPKPIPVGEQPDPKRVTEWGKPISLGPNINTPGADFAPFLASDNKTLYFASDGHGGYGKSDIFYAKRLDSTWTKWSAPRNLGPVVNSPDFDAYYTVSAAGDNAYLVSSRNGTDGSKDIFRIALAPAFKPEVVTLVQGKVLDAVTKKPVRAIIHYENLITGEEIGVTESSPVDGSYTIVLPAGVQYGYRAESPDYIAENASLDATTADKYSEKNQDLFMVPFKVGQKVKLNNIFFPQSKFYLQPSSFPELLRLVKILRDYPTVEILIGGHTDNQGDPALNVKLSEDRVEAVKKYLVSKGIDAKRLSTKGLGGAEPIASNEQEETRRFNRRVEFTITKK